jgi:hypothetical protein
MPAGKKYKLLADYPSLDGNDLQRLSVTVMRQQTNQDLRGLLIT